MTPDELLEEMARAGTVDAVVHEGANRERTEETLDVWYHGEVKAATEAGLRAALRVLVDAAPEYNGQADLLWIADQVLAIVEEER